MAKIRNMGTATMRFNEGVVISGSISSDYASAEGVALVCTGSVEISGNSTNDEVLRVITNSQQKDIVFVTQGSVGASAEAALLNGDGSGGLSLNAGSLPGDGSSFILHDGSSFEYFTKDTLQAPNNSKKVNIKRETDFATMRDNIIAAINGTATAAQANYFSAASPYVAPGDTSNRAGISALENGAYSGGINLTATTAGTAGNSFIFKANFSTLTNDTPLNQNQSFSGGTNAVSSVEQVVKGSVYLDTSADLNISGSTSTVLIAGAGDFVLFPSNSVGIGAASPTTALEVSGEITADDASTEGSSIIYGDGKIHMQHARDLPYAEPAIKFERSRGTQTSPAVSVLDDDLGSITWTSWDGSSTYRTAAQIQAEADAAHSGGGAQDTPGRLSFRTTPDGSSTLADRMTIKSTGKVGIGTTNPSEILHVYANASSDYATLIENDQSTNGHGLKVTSDGTGSDTNIFDVESVSTTVFRVRGDGRVGIGKVVSLPDAVLTVSSSNTDSDIAIAHKMHHIGDPNTFIQFQDDKIDLEAGGINYIKIEENASTQDVIYINHGEQDVDFVVSGQDLINLIFTDAVNGKVGIGTNTTNEKLTVSGSLSLLELDAATIPGHTTDYGKIYTKATDHKLYFKNYAGTEYDLTLGASTAGGANTTVQYNNNGSIAGSAAFVFDGTNVGLGYSSPSAHLEIYDDRDALADVSDRANYSLFLESLGTDAGEGVGIGFSRAGDLDDVGAAIIFERTGAESKGHLQFRTKGTTSDGGGPGLRMRINDDGITNFFGGTAINVAAGNNNGIMTVGYSDGASAQMAFDTNTIQAKAATSGNATTLYINSLGGDVKLGANATLHVDSTDERVGIGDITPGAKLHVAVNDQSNYALRVFNDSSAANPIDQKDYWGVRVSCGEQIPEDAGDCRWHVFADGSGDDIAYAEYATAGDNYRIVGASDERIKVDIADTKVNATDIFKQIQMKEFRKVRKGRTTKLDPLGFIAQNLEPLIPDMVVEIPSDEHDFDVKHMGTVTFIPYLVKAVKELIEKNEALEARIKALEDD
jgi:hypothetical protein